MSELPFPTWQAKTEAIRQACEWATGVCGDWKYKKEAFSLPDNNTAWFELKMGRMRELGVDEIRSSDNIDPNTGLPNVENPRLETVCGQRQFFVELRTFNRDQEHDAVAWLVAERARARLRFPYVRDRWFRAHAISIVELFEVVPMPDPKKVEQQRWLSEAILEVDLATVIVETDGAAIGTWIETVEISSKLHNPGGVLLDPTIQLDNEVMP